MELFDKSVKLTVVTDPHFGESAASRLTSNIVAAASEFQQDLTKERMAETRAAMKAKGMRVAGRVPLGYTIDRLFNRMVIVPEEVELIEDFFNVAARGNKPTQIAETANRRDSGRGHWNARRILQILSNRVYAGFQPEDADSPGSLLKGNHEAIVSLQIYELVQKQIASRRTRKPSKRDQPLEMSPLRGLLVCAKCNRAMTTNSSGYGVRRYRRYGFCSVPREQPSSKCRGREMGFSRENEGLRIAREFLLWLAVNPKITNPRSLC